MKHTSVRKLDSISGCSVFPHNPWGVYEHLIYIKVKIVFLIQYLYRFHPIMLAMELRTVGKLWACDLITLPPSIHLPTYILTLPSMVAPIGQETVMWMWHSVTQQIYKNQLWIFLNCIFYVGRRTTPSILKNVTRNVDYFLSLLSNTSNVVND